jgi:hypothetical protein
MEHIFLSSVKAVKDVWRKGGMEDMRLKLEHLESATQTLDVIWELSGQDRLQILNFGGIGGITVISYVGVNCLCRLKNFFVGLSVKLKSIRSFLGRASKVKK